MNAPTRRKKKRPKELPFTFSVAGREQQTKTVPSADHPFFAPMPVWGRPGLLVGNQPSTEFEHYKAHVFYSIPPNIKETLGLDDGVLAEIPFPEFLDRTQRTTRDYRGTRDDQRDKTACV